MLPIYIHPADKIERLTACCGLRIDLNRRRDMKWQLMIAMAVLCLVTAPRPTSAHHSTAMYDNEHPITVTGVVKKFDWTNPHAFVFLEVKDPKGNPVEWEVEMMSLNHLRSYGWTSKTVKPGDMISCTGSPAKSGAPSMISNRMKLADGREIKS
jgi:Family of unknown function (DUF6152)